MSSLSPKDRVSLCSFTFADGRRCLSPRTGNHPHFCFDHAQKVARARATKKLSKDLAYFFSGGYLSACDLSTALGRLIPAVVRGDLKPKAAHTVAYLAQTLMQAIHLSKHEYINAFGTDDWRQSIRTSVNSNSTYLYPPSPQPQQPAHPESSQPQPQRQPKLAETPVNRHSVRSEESAFPESQPDHSPLVTPHPPLPQTPQPAPPPHTPLPPTSSEFVQQILAGQNSSRPPRISRQSGREPRPATASSAAPSHASPSATKPPSSGPASVHSPASAAQPAPSSQLPIAQPATSPIQSSPAAQQSGQEATEPLRPVNAALSASRQEPRPAAGPQTGPSGLPLLATPPPQKPGASPGSRSH
jgi:hypothetical protein